MTVSPREQYLYGKTVVDMQRSVWRPSSRALESTRHGGHLTGAAVDPGANASHGDVRQAEYYQQMLQNLRAAVEDELSYHRALLAAHEANGDEPGVRRSQRVICVKDTELAALCQLTDALNSRFPTSQAHSRRTRPSASATPPPVAMSPSPGRSAPSAHLPLLPESPCGSESTVGEAEGA